MVLPGDELSVAINHVGMRDGRKQIKIEVSNQRGEKVLMGSAEVDQPKTTYVFTGQGSQEVGMGMALYESSPAARAIWDSADAYLLKSYVSSSGQSWTPYLTIERARLTPSTLCCLRHSGILDPRHRQEQPQGAHRLLWWTPRSGHPDEVHADGVRGRDGQQSVPLPRCLCPFSIVHLHGSHWSLERDAVVCTLFFP